MRLVPGLVLALTAVCQMAAAQQDELPDSVGRDLLYLVRGGDCPAAIRLLNERLKNLGDRYLVFTGAMYENGVCLKRDWDRAVSYYVRAADMGDVVAQRRLAAGYFDPANGVDLASTLWWAHQASTPGLQQCKVANFSQSMQPEAFVAVRQKWDLPNVRACAYVLSVFGGDPSDPYYPFAAATAEEEGTVRLRYEPGQGRFEERRWRVGEAKDGKSNLLGYVHDAALTAISRYRDVPPVDPAWTVDLEWKFVLVPQ